MSQQFADYNCRVPIRRIMPAVLAALLAGCATPALTAEPIPSPVLSTATLSAVTPTGTGPVDTATSAATLAPVTGTTTTKVNVRQEPLASSRVLGTLPETTSLQIYARDPASNWYQIAHEAGDGGKGWVAARYVAVTDAAAVPTVGAGAGPVASVREQINVRSGPGTQFDPVGLLSAGDVVRLTGRDKSGAWLQILFAAGSDGKAWVAASFLEAAMDGLSIVTDNGEVLGTSTPAAQAPSATTMTATAVEDQDSLAAPAVRAQFSPGGVGSVFFSSDLSAPLGDGSDWIQFTPYYDSISIRLNCRGNGVIASELLRDGVAVSGAPTIDCGASQVLSLSAGEIYVLRLSVTSLGSSQTYASYTLGLLAVPAS